MNKNQFMALIGAIKRHFPKGGSVLGQTGMYVIPDMNNKWKTLTKMTMKLTEASIRSDEHHKIFHIQNSPTRDH
jgi:hypothetical protein